MLGVLFGAIQFDSVQTFFAHRLASYMSGELGSKVTIDKVSIQFIHSVVLKGLYVEDRHGDTLIYAGELNAGIIDISTAHRNLSLGRVVLSHGDFHLTHYSGEEHDNLYFLTSYFASTDTTPGKPWDVSVKEFALQNFNFRHDVKDDTAHSGIDFSHLDVKNVSGDFSELTLGDTIGARISKLTFEDKSGFRVDEFTADAKVSGTGIKLDGLVIRTPFTDIQTDLAFHYDSFPDFDEFTSRVQWESDFRNSEVSFNDIAFFAQDLYGLDRSLTLDGAFRGTVRNFRGRKVTLRWGSESFFTGNVSMNGLPYIDETFVDVQADQILTNKKDIEWLPIPPFTDKKTIVVPENLASLGTVRFKGKFTGFFSDFVAYGNVTTAIGSVSSDLNFKIDSRTHASAYSGHLAATDFDLSKITGKEVLGKVSFNVQVKGSGLRLENINARLDGAIAQLEVKNYAYRNIIVDGVFSRKMFNGSLSVNEPNVDFDFRGFVDYRQKLPEFNFIADIRRADLDTLNIFKSEEGVVLQTMIETRFSGNNLDNIIGSIDIDNTNLITGKQLFHVNNITLNASLQDDNRIFDIESDNLDAHFAGKFELAQIGTAFREVLPRFLPAVALPDKNAISRQDFTYAIRIKNFNVFSELFLPSWRFSPNTIIKGHFNSTTYDLSLKLNTDWISYGGFMLDTFLVDAAAQGGVLDLMASASKLQKSEKSYINAPMLQASAHDNRIDYHIRLSDTDTAMNKAVLKGGLEFFSPEHFALKIDSSFILVENKEWVLNNQNEVVFDSTGISIRSFDLNSANERISLNGKIAKMGDERVGLSFDGFSLNHLNTFFPLGSTRIGGVISGDAFVSGVFEKLQLETDLRIRELAVDDDTLGNANIISHYDIDQAVLTANASIIKGTAKVVEVKGKYFPKKTGNNLDFDVRLNNLYLHPIERYIDDVMSEVYGKVSADLKLTGTFARPVFNGSVDLLKTSLVVNYLQTRYSFSTNVKVRENEFILDGLKIIDVNNKEGVIRGRIYHDYFANFRFDAELNASELQILNTTINDNSLYYGVANASGYAHFYGPIDNMYMDISLSPDKGTKINIPLNSSEDLISSSYITFIDRSKDDNGDIMRNRVDLSGVRLNMNLDMNRNADISIIFDEKIGDVISGSGSGSLRLDINTSGNFNMYGTYTIEKGEYLFTLQNLINKKFNIDQGGRITWAGDPYEAIVDLSAVYVVHTSTLYNILQDTTYKRRVPVDCRLFLRNKLMNPTISYEITVRGIGPSEEGLLATMLNSEQEINRQMFGLLIFNQFLPVYGSSQSIARLDAGAGVGASASELLSNQLSNWLGQVSKTWNIAVDIKAKDTYTNEEYKVILSRSLFNDRLTLETNVGYLGDQSYLGSNVVGDFYAEYKVSRDGRFRVKGFNRSNADNIINYSQAAYSQGIGFFYRQEFNTLSDLMVKLRLKRQAEEAKQVN